MNTVLTDKQYKQLKELKTLLAEMNKENEVFHELVNDADLFGGKLDDIQGDIDYRIDIFSKIENFYENRQEIVATIVISNAIGVAIVEAESDYVFGYVQFIDGKQFFLSEVEYKIDEDEEDEDADTIPVFTIGEDGMELSLNNAMRVNF